MLNQRVTDLLAVTGTSRPTTGKNGEKLCYKIKATRNTSLRMNKHFPVAQTPMCPAWVNARSPDTQWHLLFYSTDQPKPQPCPHSFQFWFLLQPTDKPLFNCTFEYLIMWFPDNDAIISSSSCNMYNHIIFICLSVKEAEETVLF